jgi:hypothetical protein
MAHRLKEFPMGRPIVSSQFSQVYVSFGFVPIFFQVFIGLKNMVRLAMVAFPQKKV